MQTSRPWTGAFWVAVAALMIPRIVDAQTLIAFPSLDPAQGYHVQGTLYLPEQAARPVPAVVVVHGTTGIDSRGAFYRKAILDAGVAFFEVDFRTGIYTSPSNRPRPAAFLPLAFSALKELRKQPGIDPDRIAIMGFSLGGNITLGTAFEANRRQWLGSDKGFAAHVAFYPVCKAYLDQRELAVTGAPMIIFYGSEDSYGEAKNVPALKRLLHERAKFDVTTVEYAGAAHGFNRNEAPLRYMDPAAVGRQGYMAWDEAASRDSLGKVVDFLNENLVGR